MTNRIGEAVQSPVARRQLLKTVAGLASAALLSGVFACRVGARPIRSSRTSPQSRFHTVNGVRLHYLDWGNSGAHPFVLLHPAPLNAHAWDVFAHTVAPFYHVVAPDARGFGESDWGASYETDVFVEDVHALVTALRADRIILCGNSMGASVAMAYAAMHSGVVERLILVDTGPGPRAAAPSPPPIAAGARRSGPPQIPSGPFVTRDDAVRQLTALAGPEFARIVTDENLKQSPIGTWDWKYDHKGTAGGIERSMRDPRRWSRWLAVTCPTLVLRGARSPAFTQAAAEEMVSQNRNASLVVIPDAGHFIALEQPAAFERAVREWLRI